MIKIGRVRSATKAGLADINALLRQLSRSARTLDMKAYRRMLSGSSYILFAAKDGSRIVGMATLILMEIPVAFRSRLEDLVVDEAYRGQGIATKLTRALVTLAKKKGAVTVDFTSRPDPDRKAANQFYLKLGFERRNTNVYRLKL